MNEDKRKVDTVTHSNVSRSLPNSSVMKNSISKEFLQKTPIVKVNLQIGKLESQLP